MANATFPQPFEKGPEAIITAYDNFRTQALSFLLFVLILGPVLGIALLAIASAIATSFGFTNLFNPEMLRRAAQVGFIFCLIFGLRRTRAAENRAAKILGSYIGWWLIPSGISWWLPWPLGSVGIPIFVGETSDTINVSEVEAADNVKMSGSAVVRSRIKYPLVVTRQGIKYYSDGRLSVSYAAIAFGDGLNKRTFRWYISEKLSTNLPAAKEEASKILSGAETSFKSDEVEGRPSREVSFAINDESEDGRTVRGIAADLGREFLEVMVTDFSLPQEITDAAKQERVEEAQHRSELTEIGTLKRAMRLLKDEFPNLSDEQVLVAVQAERNKRDVINVDGSAGDFTKGAGVRTSQKRRGRSNGGE